MMRGFSASEIARLSGCLERLTPHLRLDGVAITGGIGIDVGLAMLGQPGTRDRVADLDLVATSIDAINEGVVGQFLVSHYHVVRPGVPKFMVQLVDPVSRIRIDVFPDLVGSIGDAWAANISTHRLLVLPLERILEHKVQTLSRASHASPIDPKHVHDAQILGAVLHMPVPTVAPETLAPDVYGIDDDGGCNRCELSRHADWPLAPKDRIFELLGWTQQPNIRLQPTAASAIMSRRG
jgi:hypothetical protein